MTPTMPRYLKREECVIQEDKIGLTIGLFLHWVWVLTFSLITYDGSENQENAQLCFEIRNLQQLIRKLLKKSSYETVEAAQGNMVDRLAIFDKKLHRTGAWEAFQTNESPSEGRTLKNGQQISIGTIEIFRHGLLVLHGRP